MLAILIFAFRHPLVFAVMEIQKVPAASAVEGTQLVGVALNDAAAHGGVKSELHQVGAN